MLFNNRQPQSNTVTTFIPDPSQPPPTITLEKSSEQPAEHAGDTFFYVVKVKNNSGSDAPDVYLFDGIPAGFCPLGTRPTITAQKCLPGVAAHDSAYGISCDLSPSNRAKLSSCGHQSAPRKRAFLKATLT